jgi:hypothetical protein
MALTVTKKMKWRLALLPVALILLFTGFQALRVWWFRGYSRGSRTGIVVKVTEKGPPYCKYLEGEMRVGTSTTLAPETWLFSVDDDAPTNPVVVALKDAEKKQTPVTVDYRQDLHALFRCTESEYFAVKVEK